jgi:hypothetical protein
MTMDEAIEYTTEPPIEVDFEIPEKRGYYVTMKECKTAKVELVPIIKIVVPHVVDPRDFEEAKYEGRIVAGGAAFLLQEPTVPYYLLRDHDESPDMVKMHDGVDELMDIHDVHALRILNDKTRQVKSTLFVFPSEMRCSIDFGETALLSDGAYVGPLIVPLKTRGLVLGTAKVLTFLQASWKLRVVLEGPERKLLQKAPTKKLNALEEALNGASI